MDAENRIVETVHKFTQEFSRKPNLILLSSDDYEQLCKEIAESASSLASRITIERFMDIEVEYSTKSRICFSIEIEIN